MSAKILTTAFLAIRSTIPGELAPDADAAVAVVGRAAAGRLRYAASIRILGVGFRAYVAAVDLLQALQRIVGEGSGHPASALLRQIAVVVVLKGGNLVARVRTCSDPSQLMRIVVLVEIGRPASRFAYAPVVELIVAVVLDQRGAAVKYEIDAVAVAGQHRGQPAGGVAAEDLTAITQHRSNPRMPRQRASALQAGPAVVLFCESSSVNPFNSIYSVFVPQTPLVWLFQISVNIAISLLIH